MELIYAYVKKFSGFIEEHEFIFSQRFDVKYNEKNKTLLIKEKEYIKNFFGEKIKNISLIIGKNGAGKTTLLDLLGMKRNDRSKSYNTYKDKYFLLYHIKDNIFAIEGYGLDLIKDIVNNLPLKDEYPITEPYSIVIERNIQDSYRYNYIEYMQFAIDENNKAINEKITYVNVRGKFNDRYLRTSFIRKDDYTTFANRLYGNDIGIAEKYALLRFLIKDRRKLINDDRNDDVTFSNTNVNLIIEPKLNYYMNDEKRLNLKLPKRESGKGFIQVNRINKKIDKLTPKKQLDIKQNFILNFLEKYIHEAFNEGLVGIIQESDGDVKKEEIKVQKKINDLYSKMGNKNLYVDQIEYLLEIAKMIDAKIENYIKLEDENRFYDAIEEFTKCLNKTKEIFFKNKCLKIPINLNKSEKMEEIHIMNLLNVIDKYFQDDKNNLQNDLKIRFENLSDGENKFLDVLTRIRESLKNSYVCYGDTVILLLDEPDKSFHPEWSRKFIPILLEKLNELENVKSKYQIIISTHSPFMVSDVPSDNLILLDSGINKNGKNVFRVKSKKDISKTFANNIHTILSNEFFLKSTIGEFSKIKIQKSINYIMEYKKYINEKPNNIPLKFQQSNLEEKKKEIKYIIEIIGEPLIKRKLEEIYRTTFPEERKDYELEIKKLQQEKAELQEIIKYKGLDNIEGIMKLLDEKVRELKEEAGDGV